MELTRQIHYYHTLGTVPSIPHSLDSSIITTLSGQFHYYHTLGTVPRTVPSVVIIELSRECGINGTVPRVW
jgi:hypothetical protein